MKSQWQSIDISINIHQTYICSLHDDSNFLYMHNTTFTDLKFSFRKSL